MAAMGEYPRGGFLFGGCGSDPGRQAARFHRGQLERQRHLGKQLATKLRKHKAHLERQRDALQTKVDRIVAILRREEG